MTVNMCLTVADLASGHSVSVVHMQLFTCTEVRVCTTYRPVVSASSKLIILLDCTNTNRCSCLMHLTLYSFMGDHEALHRSLHVATSTLLLNFPSRNRIAVAVDSFIGLHLTRELLNRMTVDCSHQVYMASYLCIVSSRNADRPS